MTGEKRTSTLILREAVKSYGAIVSLAPLLDKVALEVVSALRQGGKLFFCGNGGSAADAQHLAAEFLGKFLLERSPWPAVALTANSSAVTAIGNDYGFNKVFARQLQGLGRKGDVVFGISTSGRSENVVEAFRAAREIGMLVVALTGSVESPMSELADIAIRVPSCETPRIQEMHITAGHTICELAEIAMTDVSCADKA